MSHYYYDTQDKAFTDSSEPLESYGMLVELTEAEYLASRVIRVAGSVDNALLALQSLALKMGQPITTEVKNDSFMHLHSPGPRPNPR